MTTIDVHCSADPGGDWTCAVVLRDDDRDVSSHEVTVRSADLARLAPDAADPTDLVERSFAFLLEREPPSSILRRFDLLEIARYFPDYERVIRGR